MDGPLGDYIRKEFAAKNIVAMPKAWNSGMRQTTSSVKPIRTAEDMTGFRIRTAEAKMAVELFKTLGASPTPMPIVELYTALQTHVVDGQDTPLVTIAASRFYEVQKYLSLLNDSWSCHYLVANIDSWKSLPADLQSIVERNAAKYADLERRDTILMNGSIGDKLIRQGLATNKVDPTSFRARLSPYYKTWSAAFGATQWRLLEDAIGSKLA